MQINIVTVFPRFFEEPLRSSIVGRAVSSGLVSFRVVVLRDFTEERYRLLHILSSQAANALEKARLHEEQARLIEAQHRFVPQQFLDSLGHSNLFDV